MTKKLIIIVLILIILISLGIIGYIVIGQGQIDLAKFWPLGGQGPSQPVSLPVFPTSTEIPTATSTETSATSSFATETATGTSRSLPEAKAEALSDLNLAETNALGLILFKDAQTDQIIFIDRPTGNIYSLGAGNNLQRLTYTTLTGIGFVQWGRDKTNYYSLIGYLDGRNKNFYRGKFALATSTEAVALELEPVQDKIVAAASSPDKLKVFTLEENGGGVTGYIFNWNDKTKKKVWAAPVSNWSVDWPQADLISLTTKPAAGIGGSLFLLNPTTGSLKTVLTNISGLEVMINPSGSLAVFSRGYGGKTTLYSLDLKSNKSEIIGINTLASKCLWSSDKIVYCAVPKSIPIGLYPDDWQKGRISFSDDIWEIDLVKKTTIMALPLKGDYDLTNLAFSAQKKALYAINKADGSIQTLILP